MRRKKVKRRLRIDVMCVEEAAYDEFGKMDFHVIKSEGRVLLVFVFVRVAIIALWMAIF